jgi:hypothetical protein
MSAIVAFNGTQDVINWCTQVKAKLISKGYKNHLLDTNRPGGDQRAAWDGAADKAVGFIMTFMDPDVSTQFVDNITPQTLLEAIVARYRPNQQK